MGFSAGQKVSVLTELGSFLVRARPEEYERFLRVTEEQDSTELRRAAAALRELLAEEFDRPIADRADQLQRLRRVAERLESSEDEDLWSAGAGIASALLAVGA
jgi:hypothetical protein